MGLEIPKRFFDEESFLIIFEDIELKTFLEENEEIRTKYRKFLNELMEEYYYKILNDNEKDSSKNQKRKYDEAEKGAIKKVIEKAKEEKKIFEEKEIEKINREKNNEKTSVEIKDEVNRFRNFALTKYNPDLGIENCFFGLKEEVDEDYFKFNLINSLKNEKIGDLIAMVNNLREKNHYSQIFLEENKKSLANEIYSLKNKNKEMQTLFEKVLSNKPSEMTEEAKNNDISEENKPSEKPEEQETMPKYIPESKKELEELVDNLEINLGDIDTSKITDMSFLFSETKRKDFSGIEKWDTSNVKNMGHMFSSASSFNQDISKWDVSSVKNMTYMFAGAENFNQDISSWNVSNVQDMNCMFGNAKSFNQDISKWNTSNVEDMARMFFGAIAFNQPIGDWNTSKVKTMTGMFDGAKSFNQDIGNWDTSRVKDMAGMFYGATEFNQDISKWDTSNVEEMTGMFDGAISFNQDISKWDTSSVWNMRSMFEGATSFNQDISKWNTSNVEYMEYIFDDCPISEANKPSEMQENLRRI